MKKFRFSTTKESQDFCESIVLEMINLFNIEEEEAWARVSEFWKRSFDEGDSDIRYHETKHFWAMTMYYGHDSYWWKREGDQTLKPLPYPSKK